MVEWLNSWTQGIVIAIIIATIIEMILPEGKNKKYIKTVIGIYIIFTIISPVISKFSGKELLVDVNAYEKYFEVSDTTSIGENITQKNNQNIEQIYLNNLTEDMKGKIKQKGYIVDKIDIEIQTRIETEYGAIKKIVLTLRKIQTNLEEEQDNNSVIDNTIVGIIVDEVEKIDVKINNTQTQNNKNTQNIVELTTKEKNELKEYLNSTYEVDKKNITIN